MPGSGSERLKQSKKQKPLKESSTGTFESAGETLSKSGTQKTREEFVKSFKQGLKGKKSK